MTLPVLTATDNRPYAPRVSAFTKQFWDGLEQGRFCTTRCEQCARLTFPPKAHCPACWAMRQNWCDLSGQGRLYAYTINHVAPRRFADQGPYAVGIVDLDEGVRVFCRLLDHPDINDIAATVQMVAIVHPDGPLFAARLTSRPSFSATLPVQAR